MKLKKRLIFIILFSTIFSAVAQVKGLKIGQILPDFSSKIIHDKGNILQVSDYRDKLLLIDFWATGCSGCVAALPKMQALQQRFGNQVKILPVTNEKEDFINNFWKNNIHTKSLSIPTVVEDTVFEKLFPYRAIPHEIWIYKGKIIGITDPEYVDSANIQRVLSGEIPNWPLKDDFYFFNAAKEPLFVPDAQQIDLKNNWLEYAAVSDYKEHEGANAAGVFGEVGKGSVRDSIKKTVRTWFINMPIFNAYWTYWNNLIAPESLKTPSFMMTPNQIVWKVNDPSRYVNGFPGPARTRQGYYGDWLRKNAICFESMYADKGQTDKEIFKSVIADLDKLFGLHVRWEKRKEKVLLLVKKTGSAKAFEKIQRGTKIPEGIISLSDMLYKLNNEESNPYVFDETAYQNGKSIGLALDVTSWTDIENIRKIILPYGLDLKIEERLVDKFIFEEVNGTMLIDPTLISRFKAEQQAQKDMEMPAASLNETFLEGNINKPGITVLPSGLQYKIIKKGSGPIPAVNDKVSANYKGTFINGKMFDSSDKYGRPVVFEVADVMKGWAEALQLMPSGSKWVLYIPSKLAYGEVGSLNVPPNSTLIFEIELVRVHRK